jgi:hypothetical protein
LEDERDDREEETAKDTTNSLQTKKIDHQFVEALDVSIK